MRIKLLIAICILFSIPYYAQNDLVEITINVITELQDPTANIFIVGNNKDLGNWQPNLVKLEKRPTCWSKTFTFKSNTFLEFKFTKGSWESEALDENGKIPWNHILKVKSDTTLSFSINLWNDASNTIAIEGQITGNVVYHNKFTYQGLLPRDIIVWLPPDYEKDIHKNYPVLYMHDGQNMFNPKTSYTKVDWQIDEAADSLIRKNEIPPMIIVGISNSAKRTAEYTPGNTNKIYMK